MRALPPIDLHEERLIAGKLHSTTQAFFASTAAPESESRLKALARELKRLFHPSGAASTAPVTDMVTTARDWLRRRRGPTGPWTKQSSDIFTVLASARAEGGGTIIPEHVLVLLACVAAETEARRVLPVALLEVKDDVRKACDPEHVGALDEWTHERRLNRLTLGHITALHDAVARALEQGVPPVVDAFDTAFPRMPEFRAWVASGASTTTLNRIRAEFRNPLIHGRATSEPDWSTFVELGWGPQGLRMLPDGSPAPSAEHEGALFAWLVRALDPAAEHEPIAAAATAWTAPAKLPVGVAGAPESEHGAVPHPRDGNDATPGTPAATVIAADPLAVIERYDVEFDIPLRHHEAIGLLVMRGHDRAPVANGPLELAAFVGTQWCRVVEHDVYGEQLALWRAVARGQAAAESLAAKLPQAELDPSNHTRVAYVLARWFDGAGKAAYRRDDFTAARMALERAASIAATHALWWVEADIESNLIRATYEEQRTAAATDRGLLVERYLEAIRRHADRRGTAYGAPADVARRHEDEHRRGLCSLYHNLSTHEAYPADLRRQASERSESIARQLHDRYRLAQALTQQALLPGDLADEERVALWQEVQQLPWQRGRRIAQQRMARIALDGGDVANAVKACVRLLDESASERETAGDEGADIAFHHHTLRLYSDAIRSLPTPEVAMHRERLEHEQVALARSLRDVVTVTQYKEQLSKFVTPAYVALVRRSLDDDHDPRPEPERLEGTVAWVEEASARTLLDLMADAPRLTPEADTEAPRLILDASPARPSTGRRRRAMRRTRLDEGRAREVLARRAERYAARLLQRPIRTMTHDKDIGRRLRLYTAAHPDECIVRFGVADIGDGADPATRRLFAVIARRGALRTVPLADPRPPTLSPGAPAPTPTAMAALWERFVSPWWSEDLVGTRVTMVPTDDLFELPLQAALHPTLKQPLGACVRLAVTASLTAYISRGRHLLARQQLEPEDDLCVMLATDDDIDAAELGASGWSPDRLHIATGRTSGLPVHQALGAPSRETLPRLEVLAPEVFVFIGHGARVGGHGAVLQLDGDLLMPEDVAGLLRLPRNRLSLLNACVSGTGVAKGGGEVSGFVRALVAAGAGAIGVTTWSVLDDVMGRVAGAILAGLNAARAQGDVVDLVSLFYEVQHLEVTATDSLAERIERCPLLLVL